MIPLSHNAITTLGQLFVNGPTWDGNLVTKQGRDELLETKLAERWDGWTWLTKEGVQLATTVTVQKGWFSGKWFSKVGHQ